MTAYYNEIDPFAAQWLRNLIAAGHLPAGDVDERDIRDVCADDLAGYAECHFFAGIGIWPLALRMAGWPAGRPVWTGSCPCQPFSQAGKGAGFADERHLWPSWHWLIEQRRPDTIFGEQVEGPDGRTWLDLVCTDLEAGGYTVAPTVLCSAGVGAPNIRERIFWVADTGCQGRRQDPRGPSSDEAADGGAGWNELKSSGNHVPCCYGADGEISWLADPESRGCGKHGILCCPSGFRQDPGQPALCDETAGIWLGNAGEPRLPHAEPLDLFGTWWRGKGRATEQPSRPPDPWRELEWIDCTDGRRRPSQPGIFPLAPRHPGDVGRLRAYGNAINPWAAAEAIGAYLDVTAA